MGIFDDNTIDEVADKDRICKRACELLYSEWYKMYGSGSLGYIYDEHELITWLIDAIMDSNEGNLNMYRKGISEGRKGLNEEDIHIARWFIRKARCEIWWENYSSTRPWIDHDADIRNNEQWRLQYLAKKKEIEL